MEEDKRKTLIKAIITRRSYEFNMLMTIHGIPFDNLSIMALKLLVHQMELAADLKLDKNANLTELAVKIVESSQLELNFLVSDMK